MLIGKAGPARTSISTADASRIEVRGRDLCADLMGRLTFSQYFFLLVTGREPTEQQSHFLDLLLVSLAEHGLTPSVQAARMTYRAAPDCLQGAVAAGILGCGSVVLGTAELCAQVLVDARRRIDAGEEADAVAHAIASEIRERGGKMPGFGHPLHNPVDPRTERILQLAQSRSVGGRHVDLALRFRPAVERAWNKPLPMNVSMAIAAVLLDLDFPASVVKAIPILSRTAGLLAHLAEEADVPIGFLMASHGEAAISYERPKTAET